MNVYFEEKNHFIFHIYASLFVVYFHNFFHNEKAIYRQGSIIVGSRNE